jgi:hypothetical protein
VTGYELDDRGVKVGVPAGSKIFTSPYCPEWFWDPPNLLSNGYWKVLSLEVKILGREADHSPPIGTEKKKIMDLHINSPCLHGIVLN